MAANAVNHSHGRVYCSVPRSGVASARLTLKKPSPPEPSAPAASVPWAAVSAPTKIAVTRTNSTSET